MSFQLPAAKTGDALLPADERLDRDADADTALAAPNELRRRRRAAPVREGIR